MSFNSSGGTGTGDTPTIIWAESVPERNIRARERCAEALSFPFFAIIATADESP